MQLTKSNAPSCPSRCIYPAWRRANACRIAIAHKTQWRSSSWDGRIVQHIQTSVGVRLPSFLGDVERVWYPTVWKHCAPSVRSVSTKISAKPEYNPTARPSLDKPPVYRMHSDAPPARSHCPGGPSLNGTKTQGPEAPRQGWTDFPRFGAAEDRIRARMYMNGSRPFEACVRCDLVHQSNDLQLFLFSLPSSAVVG